jgi:hypothetical protein
MVKGLELFREHFRSYSEQYMLIGGTACSIIMENAGLEFRATKDLDIVLCAEALTDDFFKAFWDFVQAGGYEIRQKSSGKPQLYRFSKPADKRYPYMLELFSRRPDFRTAEDAHLTPIPSDDEVYSLSAILLNDDYYAVIREGVTVINGISLVDAKHLIPLKAKAFLDLRRRKLDGENIDDNAVAKHKRDIFRLLTVTDTIPAITLPGDMKSDIDQFIAFAKEKPLVLKDIGITEFSFDDLLENLSLMYL